MLKLVVVRHGESLWNKENRFTGWTDIDLSTQGIEEAKKAGQILKAKGYTFDVAFTSVLKRAIRTLWVMLDELDLMWLSVHNSWRLNERHYGALQGLNKVEMAKQYGEQQVQIWRRSYAVKPPLLTVDDPRYSANDPKYAGINMPFGESLQDTVARFIPYWQQTLAPVIQSGKRVLISAHGNSLRALVKYLDNVSDADIVALNIPTGIPLVYELDENLKPIRHYYLGDEDDIKKAIQAVASQGKAK